MRGDTTNGQTDKPTPLSPYTKHDDKLFDHGESFSVTKQTLYISNVKEKDRERVFNVCLAEYE